MRLRPGDTYLYGFDFGPVGGDFDDRFGLVIRNGSVAESVAVDFDPTPGLPGGNFMAIAVVPAEWSAGDVVQLAVVGVYGGLSTVRWLPAVTLGA